MKRTHLTMEADDEEDAFFEEVSDDSTEVLRQRLRGAEPTFGLRAGESVIEIEGADQLKNRKQWHREDGTVVEHVRDTTGKITSIKRTEAHENEEDYGPGFREEEFQRRDIVNKDARIGFLRLLAGCTHQNIEDLFDEGDLHNQRLYDEELRAWNKLERERIMVGSDEKKTQLDIVEARRESMHAQREALDWSFRFINTFTDEMTFLFLPYLRDDSSSHASLPLCLMFAEQYILANELMTTLQNAEQNKEVLINPNIRKRFLSYFAPNGRKPSELFEHKLADGFLEYAINVLNNYEKLSYDKFLQFALSLYKYLFTRDEYAPMELLVTVGTFDPSNGGVRALKERRKVSMKQIMYETTEQLFFLYIKSQAMQLYFIEFKRALQWEMPSKESATSSKEKEKGKTRGSATSSSSSTIYSEYNEKAIDVGMDDLDFFRRYKVLEGQLANTQSKLARKGLGEEAREIIHAEIRRIIGKMESLASARVTRFENLLEALKTPVTTESFKQLFSSGKPTFVNDPILATLHRTLQKNSKQVSAWFNEQNQVTSTKSHFLLSTEFTTPKPIYFVVAGIASVIQSITPSNIGVWTDFPELTEAGRRYLVAYLMCSPHAKITKNKVTEVFAVEPMPDNALLDFGYTNDPLTFPKAAILTFNEDKKLNFNVTLDLTHNKEIEKFWDEYMTLSKSIADVEEIHKREPRLNNIISTLYKKYTTILEQTAFNADKGLDIYNVAWFKTGFTPTWTIDKSVLGELTFLEIADPVLGEIPYVLHEPLLSGCMGALALFAQNEHTIALFQPNALEVPLAQHTRLALLSDDERIKTTLEDTTQFLVALDKVMDNLQLSGASDDAKKLLGATRKDTLANRLSFQWHRSLDLILHVIAWNAFIYPRDSGELQREIDRADAVIRDAQAELYRLAMGGEASIKTQRDKVKELYAPSARWQMRPEFTGRIELAPTVVLALDHALTIVRETVPTLADATLDALMLCDMESGLPGAFARFVGALMNKTQLTWPHTYNKDLQYRIDPLLRKNCQSALQGYRVRMLPGGRYEATRDRGGQAASAACPKASSSLSVIFI